MEVKIPTVDEMEFTYCVLGHVWGACGPITREDGSVWEGNNGGFSISYGIKNFGFGSITFHITKDGKLECDAETCGRKFIQRVLKELTLRTTITGNCGAEDTPPEVVEQYKHGAEKEEEEKAMKLLEEEGGGAIFAPELLTPIDKVKDSNAEADGRNRET